MEPKPKAINVVCTVCDLSWEKHLAGPRKKNPTLEDCVRVLKAEIAARPRQPWSQVSGTSINPYVTVPFYGNQSGRAQ